jgi:hypothetical protein
MIYVELIGFVGRFVLHFANIILQHSFLNFKLELCGNGIFNGKF